MFLFFVCFVSVMQSASFVCVIVQVNVVATVLHVTALHTSTHTHTHTQTCITIDVYDTADNTYCERLFISIGNMSFVCILFAYVCDSNICSLSVCGQYKIFYFVSRQRETLNPIGALLRAVILIFFSANT